MSAPFAVSASNGEATPTLAPRIQDRSVGPARLLTLKTEVEDVVSWRGSFLAYPDLAAGDDILQKLTVSLLDKGTEHRDRFELARVLEDCGAKLDLSSDGLYVEASGRSLVNDLPRVMDVLAEMLRVPSFDEEEFEKARAQAIGQVQRQMEQTGPQASNALTRRLFAPGHPNYSEAPERVIDRLRQLSVSDIRSYHAKHFGSTEWTMVMVGDIDHDTVKASVGDAFDGWSPHEAEPTHDTDGAPDEDVGRTEIPMRDKSNVDVRMGHTVPVRRNHKDYPALYVGNYILGGDFAARFMNIVRDEKGLTYHIGSGLSGVSTRYSGYWQVRITLSKDTVEAGITATKDVLRTFVDEGATEEELSHKKTTITGSYAVGLATTRRLAQSILTNAERGFDLSYLDRFPEEIRDVTLDDVNEAVRTYLRPEELHETLAGVEAQPLEA